jgi:chromate transporter
MHPGSDQEALSVAPAATIAFADAFRFWLLLGFVSFGGPAGQIAIMHREIVERRRWLSERRFLHALNYCMVLPGPEAQQLATYIGWLMHRTRGGLVAGLLFVLPSLVLLVALSWVYVAYGHAPIVAAVFTGIKPAVVAIVCFAAWRLGTRVVRNGAFAAIAVTAFVAIAAFDVPFPAIVVAAGLVGWAGQRLQSKWFVASEAHDARGASHGPAVIDDDTPPPPHARTSFARAFGIVGTAVTLWIGTLAAIAATFGFGGTLFQMGWFFTKAALVTFGGAYAVLPYVFQGAVDQHGWLTTAQMIDGLALGETTPGPLIMVVAFVGFLGAWADAAAMSLRPDVAGIAGALCVTWFTFLPSFLFVFLGAPFIEATRANLHLRATLGAITAAAVGVLLDLALLLASHVLWPQGLGGAPSMMAAVIALAAAIALFRFGVGVVPVVAGAAAVGFGLGLIEA